MSHGLEHPRRFDDLSGPDDDPPADDILLRIHPGPDGPERLLQIEGRYAVLGRGAGTDLRINDPAVSDRHLYLHLDPRGLFAIDLATRTGTRFNGRSNPTARLRAGVVIEVAGRRIEVLRLRCNHQILPNHAPDLDDPALDLLARTPLDADAPSSRPATVVLEPVRSRETAWSVESELVVIGHSTHCGISIRSPHVARTHCILARDPAGAVLVNLVGRDVWIEDKPVLKSTRLNDGDFLAVGAAGFHARIKPAPPPLDRPPASLPVIPSQSALEGWTLPAPPALESLSTEHREALWGWILSAIHACQLRILERQDEYLNSIAHLLDESRRAPEPADNDRLARIEQELALLRDELRAHPAAAQSPALTSSLNSLSRNAFAVVPSTPRPTENPPAGETNHTSAAWLLERVQELDRESQSAWRTLLDRLAGRVT